MNKQQKTSTTASSFSSFVYMSLWVMGAFGALVYMAFLMGSADLDLKPLAKSVEVTKPQPTTEKLLADIRDGIGQTNHSLKQLNVKYYGLDNQVAKLRKDVDFLAQNNSKLTRKVNTLQSTISPQTSKRPIDKSDITGSVIPLSKTKSLRQNKAALQTNNKKSKDNRLKITKPVMKQMQKKHMPKKITPKNITQTQFAVSLGNFQNIKQLKKAWGKLNKKYKSALSHLKPKYITIVVNNQAQYKLVSGPLKNALDAAKICFHLQQAKTYCKQTIYHGTEI